MARRLRYQLPGATYHVMLRGNDAQKIFFNDRNRSKMCLLIQEGVERFGHRIFAYCFMANHIHLAIQIGETNISPIIQNIAFRYTQYINRQENRIGHLFQGRFRSILVDRNRYLRELVRYIHLNPVRAGIVSQPEHYQWSSHNTYLGKNELPWVSPSLVLSSFGGCDTIARPSFHSFVTSGIFVKDDLDFKRGISEGILGDDDFVQRVVEKGKPIPDIQLCMPELVQAACDHYKINLATLVNPGKNRLASNVRAMLALLVRESDDLTLGELSSHVRRDQSTLSKHAARLAAKSLECKVLQNEISELKAYILQMSECQD